MPKRIVQRSLRARPTVPHAKLNASWCLATHTEREHRLQTVIALSVELEKLRETIAGLQTMLAKQAIERVIEGDWEEVEDIVALLSFEDEDEATKSVLGPLWKPFMRVAAEACQARSPL